MINGLMQTLFPGNTNFHSSSDAAYKILMSMKHYKKIGRTYKEWEDNESKKFKVNGSLIDVWEDLKV